MRAKLAKWRLTFGNLKEKLLHTIMPGRMKIVSYKWPLIPEICACDVHFSDYLLENNVRQKSVFHFGTGSHHVVGTRNLGDKLENDIFGITAAPGEQSDYVKLVTRDAALAEHYKVLFADIYTMNAASLPQFDVISLFHLCEFTPAADAVGRLDDRQLLDVFLSRLKPGGRILFYASSFAADRTLGLVEEKVAEGRLAQEATYKSLLAYRLK